MPSPSRTIGIIENYLAQRFGVIIGGNRVRFVCNANSAANNSNSGFDPTAPLSTVDYAIGLCTAGRGDVIVVLPGHAENITAAAAIACDVAGVTIVGIGNGRNRPKFTWTTATTATITITAANVSWFNCVFDLTGFDAVATGFSISAADATFDGCEFDVANATNQAVLGITTTAAANRLVFRNNWVHGTTDAGNTSFFSIVGGDSILIENNHFILASGASAGIIANATTDSTNMVIHNNRILNKTASSTKAIVLTASSTGFITNNRIGILSGTAPLTAAAMNVAGNVYSAAAGVTAGTASTF